MHVIMYHYVRDLPRTQFPAIKGMMLDCFRVQVDELRQHFEMATLRTALEFLAGTYEPRRDLCLLTFDDGLREHYEQVTPILAERRIQGLFFLITSSIAEGRVAPVHMNHFLMAKLGFEEYSKHFERLLREQSAAPFNRGNDEAVARRTYPWDTPEIASFKYVFNFILSPVLRDRLVTAMFELYIAPQQEFSRELYLTWSEAREMQAEGMVLGGHTHEHRPLAALSDSELEEDLRACRMHLDENVRNQPVWPFCYPYGKRDSFDSRAVRMLKHLDFNCAFSTEAGPGKPEEDLFAIPRIDCNRVETSQIAA